jgi:hypothetical protein
MWSIELSSISRWWAAYGSAFPSWLKKSVEFEGSLSKLAALKTFFLGGAALAFGLGT